MTFRALLLIIALPVAAFGQMAQDAAAVAAKTITAEDISEYLHVLSSDEFEGRETGTPGNEKAAQYIAERFSEFGIPPLPSGDYFQEVQFSRTRMAEARLTLDTAAFRHMKDYLVMPGQMPSESFTFAVDEILFLGYGIEDERYSDYEGETVDGKVILIYAGEPVDKDGISQVTGTSQLSVWSLAPEIKLRIAATKGAAAVIVVEPDFREMLNRQRIFMLTGGTIMGVPENREGEIAPAIHISSTMLEQLLGKNLKKVIRRRTKMQKKGKSKSLEVPASLRGSFERRVRTTPGVNVLAYIEGIDPKLKEELVVLTAHYDHIGRRGDDIFNGADDNASGTSGLIEIAEAMMQAKNTGTGPRRSVLCMLVTGEEKGLLGSQYYVENPVFPLDNTIANVNIDMIGRVDQKHADDPNYVYVIGSDRMSTELHHINEAINTKYLGLELDYTYNAKDDPNQFYYRSDHYNFAKNGIPAIFFFSGVHEDYHRSTDTADKINFDKAEKIARLAFHVAWELANRDKRIEVDVME